MDVCLFDSKINVQISSFTLFVVPLLVFLCGLSSGLVDTFLSMKVEASSKNVCVENDGMFVGIEIIEMQYTNTGDGDGQIRLRMSSLGDSP